MVARSVSLLQSYVISSFYPKMLIHIFETNLIIIQSKRLGAILSLLLFILLVDVSGIC